MSISAHEGILIRGLKEGNSEIFDYIFHYYYSGLVVFAQKYLEDEQAAEDVVQDFFVKLWAKRSRIDIKGSLKTYFFTAIKNSCIDYLRSRDAREKKIRNYSEASLDLIEDTNYLLEQELRTLIENSINKLPPVCREVFMMNRFEGLKPKEIAEKKGISPRTVETHIGKALKVLKKDLGAYLPLALVAFVL